ncbi:hypothetical protein Tco_1219514 [Tanacetum coccineum]
MRVMWSLGFDASTNTLKMVCVLPKDYVPPSDPNMVRKNLCTMVHVFGTNSWREIPQVPPYCITDGAVFANGCLHWLVSHIDIKTEDGGRPVIWFDVEKQEFGLIDRPKRMCDLWRNYSCSNDHLVDLNGEVGYVCARTMEVPLLAQELHKVYSWRTCSSRTMSSPDHPTSNMEDAFSSNFPNYLPPASSNFIPTSPGTTYSSSSNSFGIVPLASPALSLFHDDLYMKVLQAFYTEKSPILPPTIIPPSLIPKP